MLKLNLGCGNALKEGFHNIDVLYLSDSVTEGYTYLCENVMRINEIYRAESVDQVVAEHLFEHLTHYEITTLLFKIHSVLKPGGILSIVTPDFIRLINDLKKQTSQGDFSFLDIAHLKIFSTEDETMHRTIWYDDVGVWYLTREGLFGNVTIAHPTDTEIRFNAIRI